jgi:GABA(A) receptor-associated protein
MDFKNKYSFEERQSEATRIRSRYTDRIPIICQKAKYANRACPTIDKTKYLIPADLTIGQFIWVIRTRLQIPQHKALFMFIDGVIPPVSKLISRIDTDHRDKDGFVYMYYNMENTFG